VTAINEKSISASVTKMNPPTW